MNIKSEENNVRELTIEQKGAMVQILTSIVVSYIAEDNEMSIDEAFEHFYNSDVAMKIENYNNLLYREGPGYIYSLYLEE